MLDWASTQNEDSNDGNWSKISDSAYLREYTHLWHWWLLGLLESATLLFKLIWNLAFWMRRFSETCWALINYEPPDPWRSFEKAFSRVSVENSPRQTYLYSSSSSKWLVRLTSPQHTWKIRAAVSLDCYLSLLPCRPSCQVVG